MPKPIYKLFLAKPTEAWHQLSEDEQQSLMSQVTKALETVGGKTIIGCDSSWSSEQWQFFGVEEYPDIEAVRKLSEIHNQLNWHRYVDSMTVLGTKWPET